MLDGIPLRRQGGYKPFRISRIKASGAGREIAEWTECRKYGGQTRSLVGRTDRWTDEKDVSGRRRRGTKSRKIGRNLCSIVYYTYPHLTHTTLPSSARCDPTRLLHLPLHSICVISLSAAFAFSDVQSPVGSLSLYPETPSMIRSHSLVRRAHQSENLTRELPSLCSSPNQTVVLPSP